MTETGAEDDLSAIGQDSELIDAIQGSAVPDKATVAGRLSEPEHMLRVTGAVELRILSR